MSNSVQIQSSIFDKYESNRYGIISMLLIVVGCSAGIAVGLGALTQVASLIVLSFTTMTALSMILAIAPMKYVFITSAIAIVADILIILFNLI
jgi:hypothetical protein